MTHGDVAREAVLLDNLARSILCAPFGQLVDCGPLSAHLTLKVNPGTDVVDLSERWPDSGGHWVWSGVYDRTIMNTT